MLAAQTIAAAIGAQEALIVLGMRFIVHIRLSG